MKIGHCRFCGKKLSHIFVDLGISPLANSYLRPEQLDQMEPCYPLKVYICDACYLVQLEEFKSPESIFSDYAYFSSCSDSWIEHSRAYSDFMVERFSFNSSSQVVEIGSNDGYLLKYFRKKGIPVLGIEPARNCASVAQTACIPTLVRFFGKQMAEELVDQGKRADLLIGNNVLAHVPHLNDFVMGLKILLGTGGVITMEFPHLLKLIEQNQFDTIYHEHLSYFSFITVEKIFAEHQLMLFDVEEIPTHGGSLRIYAKHSGDESKSTGKSVERLRDSELLAGMDQLQTYSAFSEKAKETKRKLLEFLIWAKDSGKTIAGYGAPAKGNTLLNYCGIRTDFIDYTVDRNPLKQGRFLPGTHIPVYPPDRVKETRPDYLLILPWNIKDEVIHQMSFIQEWGGKFVVPIPSVEVLS
jgi:2-polyprenyl-3-methyl-5-hydroxy-6-metoxy-1,4-benzoquinol methylase